MNAGGQRGAAGILVVAARPERLLDGAAHPGEKTRLHHDQRAEPLHPREAVARRTEEMLDAMARIGPCHASLPGLVGIDHAGHRAVAGGVHRDLPAGLVRGDDDALEIGLGAHEEAARRRIAIVFADSGGATADDAVGEKLQRHRLPVRIAGWCEAARDGLLRVQLMHKAEPHRQMRALAARHLPHRELLVEAAGESHRRFHRRRHSHAQAIVDGGVQRLRQGCAADRRHPAEDQFGGGFGGAAVEAAVGAPAEHAALYLGGALVDVERAQRRAVDDGDVAAEAADQHRMIRDRGIKLVAGRIAVFGEMIFVELRRVHPFALRRRRRARLDPGDDIADRRHMGAAERHQQPPVGDREQMDMRVGEAGQHGGALQVDGVGGGGRVARRADPRHLAVAHGNGFRRGAILGEAVNPSVDEPQRAGAIGHKAILAW